MNRLNSVLLPEKAFGRLMRISFWDVEVSVTMSLMGSTGFVGSKGLGGFVIRVTLRQSSGVGS